jgi:hypothetical protein
MIQFAKNFVGAFLFVVGAFTLMLGSMAFLFWDIEPVLFMTDNFIISRIAFVFALFWSVGAYIFDNHQPDTQETEHEESEDER